jgi:hypothetical protein
MSLPKGGGKPPPFFSPEASMSKIGLYERETEDKRLVIIEDNKTASALDKIILLTEDPWVSIQGEGAFSGQFFSFIRVSYCPLSCKFCDIKTSWSDKGKTGMPMYKYDEEIVHLVDVLHSDSKSVHFETSGITVPNTLEKALAEIDDDQFLKYGAFDSIPDWVCVSPKYRDCVPEKEQDQYLFYMIGQMKFWKDAFKQGLFGGEWKFVISADDTEDDLMQAVWVIEEIYEDAAELEGVRITFQPETREEIYKTPLGNRTQEMYFQYLNDWAVLTSEVGKILPNLIGADVHILSQSHQLLNYR